MGFTVEDMLIISSDKYDMELLAGRNGWANSISWLMMVEDKTIITNFKGKELAVTLGNGVHTENQLLELASLLDEHHAAGWIINSGYYIKEIPQKLLDFCNDHDLPLLEVPWDIEVSEMMKDLMVRIFLQTETDEQISAAFIKSIESPQLEDEYREKLSASFDVDGKFQVVLITTDDLDSMDSLDRKRIGYRLQIYMENISHNAHFFYYDGFFAVIMNEVSEEEKNEIVSGFLMRASRRMPDKAIYCGEGSVVWDISNVSTSYRRAAYATRVAIRQGKPFARFDDLGMERILYSVEDEALLLEMGKNKLEPLMEYDKKHNADFLQTLTCYLKNNGSVKAVADELFIHKNTIVYRMGKIKELLGCDLEDGQERMAYYLACLIVDTQLSGSE